MRQSEKLDFVQPLNAERRISAREPEGTARMRRTEVTGRQADGKTQDPGCEIERGAPYHATGRGVWVDVLE